MNGYVVAGRQQVTARAADPDARRGLGALSQRHPDARRHPAESRPAADRLGVHRRARASRARRLRRAARPGLRAADRAAGHRPRPTSTCTASAGVPIDVPTTDRLVFDTYRYGGAARARGGRPRDAPAPASRPRWGCRRRCWSTPTPARGELDRMRRAIEVGGRAVSQPGLRAALGRCAPGALGPDSRQGRSPARTAQPK